MNFHTLQIKNIYKEIDNCTIIEFNIPEDLKEVFAFKQGQYLTLKASINNEEVLRSYSLCSAPFENKWCVAVKQISGGKFSTFANERLKKGDFLEVMPPDGKFYVEVDTVKQKKYAAFAAGSGITPVISIIKTHLQQEQESTFSLFYLNKNTNTVLFKEELDELDSKYGNRFSVYYFYTKETVEKRLFNGRFTEEKLQQINKEYVLFKEINECFLCGPQEMVFLLKDELEKLGLKESAIHFELFEAVKPSDDTPKIEAVEAEVTIIVDDEEITFTVPKGKNILEIAEQEDADVPFACKGGVCCTCKAKVIEGSVEMVVNYGLDQADLDNNLVLTCQALPTSKKVVVDYDDVY